MTSPWSDRIKKEEANIHVCTEKKKIGLDAEKSTYFYTVDRVSTMSNFENGQRASPLKNPSDIFCIPFLGARKIVSSFFVCLLACHVRASS